MNASGPSIEAGPDGPGDRVRSEAFARLSSLVKLLSGPVPQWDEVAALLESFPGWARLVEQLRNPVAGGVWRTSAPGDPEAYMTIPREIRAMLLTLFTPYAILLDAAALPGARAVRLRDQGVDVKRFCSDHLEDSLTDVAQGAREVLDACELDGSLLRGAARDDTRSLLHAQAPPPVRDEPLLHPVGDRDAAQRSENEAGRAGGQSTLAPNDDPHEHAS